VPRGKVLGGDRDVYAFVLAMGDPDVARSDGGEPHGHAVDRELELFLRRGQDPAPQDPVGVRVPDDLRRLRSMPEVRGSVEQIAQQVTEIGLRASPKW
jgi:hypothetical protein